MAAMTVSASWFVGAVLAFCHVEVTWQGENMFETPVACYYTDQTDMQMVRPWMYTQGEEVFPAGDKGWVYAVSEVGQSVTPQTMPTSDPPVTFELRARDYAEWAGLTIEVQ